MNYFIDFEATQFSNEIISIGCVNENGDEFYSLVKSQKKITDFITSLTGITQEMIENAPNSDVVFSDFFRWINQLTPPNDTVMFYCYGSSDYQFIKKNLSNTNSFQAQAALSLIGMNLQDYSSIAKSHFGLVKQIGLVKLVAYYRKVESVPQSHNALDDAHFLKEVFENISQEDIVTGHPFPEYEVYATVEIPATEMKTVNQFSDCIIEMYDKSGKRLYKTFAGLGEAVSYVIGHINPIDRARVKHIRVENKILKAIKEKSLYSDKTWKMIKPKEE